jgi:hypothetical protein
MPRRAKTGLQPLHFIGIAVFLGIVAVGGLLILNRKPEGTMSGVADLNVSEFMQNSNALSNNTYRFEGVIGDRLENWPSAEGRLFGVLVEENGQSWTLPVLVPSKFNSTNIQRGERFRFKATVQAESGLLEVNEIAKT